MIIKSCIYTYAQRYVSSISEGMTAPEGKTLVHDIMPTQLVAATCANMSELIHTMQVLEQSEHLTNDFIVQMLSLYAENGALIDVLNSTFPEDPDKNP